MITQRYYLLDKSLVFDHLQDKEIVDNNAKESNPINNNITIWTTIRKDYDKKHVKSNP